MKNILSAVAILIGTIVGAGIFSLPFVFSKAGFIIGFCYLILFGFIITALHLIYGEIILRTEENHRFVGYIEYYLGKKWKNFIGVISIIGALGSLIIYILLSADFLKILIPNISLFSDIYIYFMVWGVISIFIILGIKAMAFMELAMSVFLIAIVLLIFFIGIPSVNFENLLSFNLREIFIPYGIVFFALSGSSAVPEALEILKNKKNYLKKVIIWGTLIPAFLYFIFTFSVVGVSGLNTTKGAISGLESSLGGSIVFIGAIFGLLAIFTSFLALGLYLKNTFIHDYRFNKFLANFLTIVFPISFILIGFKDFIKISGFIGAFAGGIEGIIMLWLHKKAKKFGTRKPEYEINIPRIIFFILIAVFILGIFHQLRYDI